MQFILKGFSQLGVFRVFEFEGIAADRSRTVYAVKADLALARNNGIRLQELPLLCQAILDRDYLAAEGKRSFTFTENDMNLHANKVTSREEAAKKRKPFRPTTAGRPAVAVAAAAASAGGTEVLPK